MNGWMNGLKTKWIKEWIEQTQYMPGSKFLIKPHWGQLKLTDYIRKSSITIPFLPNCESYHQNFEWNWYHSAPCPPALPESSAPSTRLECQRKSKILLEVAACQVSLWYAEMLKQIFWLILKRPFSYQISVKNTTLQSSCKSSEPRTGSYRAARYGHDTHLPHTEICRDREW